MSLSVRTFFLIVGIFLFTGYACFAKGISEKSDTLAGYVVVVRAETLKDTQWQAVADALQTRHSAQVVTYQSDVREALLELSIRCPAYVAFLAPAEEAKPAFVQVIHRMMRELDDDPYTDAVWGIVTGYNAADALRIATEKKPLLIERGASGTGGAGSLDPFASGFGSNEGQPRIFYTKKDGNVTQSEEKSDCIRALVDGFQNLKPQCFITSGHATHKDWTVGYNYKGGQFLCDKGQLYGCDTSGGRHDINSPEPKIYMPAGNCLIGGIPEPDCMATAWIHTGGVRQMFGYTAVTWFGFGGWGIKDIFLGQPGRFTFSEAAFFNHQALLHPLNTQYGRFAGLDIPSYDHKQFNRVLGYMAQRHGMAGDTKQLLGLLWDRDVVAFYGDPAWEARMPAPADGLPWTQTFSEADGKTAFTVKAMRGGNWPNRPVMAFLPKRLRAIRVLEGEELKPVVTDTFILVPLSGTYAAGYTARVVFAGTPLVRELNGLKEAEAVLKDLPMARAAGLRYALGRAGANRRELVATLREAAKTADPEAQAISVKAQGFLINNMPLADLRAVGKDLLVANLAGALEVREKAPWKSELTDELFLNYVLPYASLNEKRESWRPDLQKRFAQRAWQQKTPGAAACWLNDTLFNELAVSYHATKRPKPNQSPGESREAGFASCTGLSILLVDACRACGIPARIAGIAQWKTPNANAEGQHGGNHMWVEVWDQGAWHCLGASEKTPLDQTWFTAKVKEASDARHWKHAVYAATWQRTGLSFPLVWNLADDSVAALNITADYIEKNSR